MTNLTRARSLGRVSGQMPTKDSTAKRVRMTSRVVSTLEELPAEQAASVARAIDRIGEEEGTAFKLPGSRAGEHYMVMIPDHEEAPVVVYRQDASGYLITGLVKRADYRTYTHPEPATPFLDTPVGQAALVAGGALVVAYLLSRARGSSTGSAGTAA